MGTSLLEIELRGGLVSAGAYDRRRCASVDCGPAVVMWCASPALRRGRSLRFWVTDLELEIRVIFSAPHGARSTLTCLTAGAIRECPTIVYLTVCQLNMCPEIAPFRHWAAAFSRSATKAFTHDHQTRRLTSDFNGAD